MALQSFLRMCAFTRKHRGPLLAASSLAVFGAQLSYHLFPEQTFRKVFQGWSGAEPVQLSARLQQLFREALEDSGCRPLSGFSAFSSYGFHPVSAGVPWLPGGCLIGIPANYNSAGAEQGAGIVERALVVAGEEVDWSSQLGAELRRSLTLSPDAQKFSVACKAVHAQSGGPVIQACVAPVCLAGVCASAVALKQLLGLYSGPVLLRGAFNLLAAAAGFAGYVLCSDAVAQWLDYRADARAAAASPDYARGGLEFYDKILARNRLLRGIMGERGERIYAPSGNLFPRHKLRLRHAPYTHRRDRLLRMLHH
ncbi:transmembrane protein 177 [Gastrophryne carolinensis]